MVVTKSRFNDLMLNFQNSQAKLKSVSDSTGQYCRLKVGSKEEVTRRSESRNPANPTWAEQINCTLMAGISFIFIEIFEKVSDAQTEFWHMLFIVGVPFYISDLIMPYRKFE